METPHPKASPEEPLESHPQSRHCCQVYFINNMSFYSVLGQHEAEPIGETKTHLQMSFLCAPVLGGAPPASKRKKHSRLFG